MISRLRYTPSVVHGRIILAALLAVQLLAILAAAPSSTAAADRPDASPAPFDLAAVDSSLVMLRVMRQSGDQLKGRQGTAVFIGKDRVLTAAHLFDAPFTQVELFFGGREGRPRQRVVLPSNRLTLHRYDGVDVAVIRNVTAPTWAAAPPLAVQPPRVGDLMTSIGLKDIDSRRIRTGPVKDATPSGGGGDTTSGAESASEGGLFNIEFTSEEGDSGGPTFNDRGELVGIHTATGTRTELKTKTVDGKTSVVGETTTTISTSADLTRLKLE